MYVNRRKTEDEIYTIANIKPTLDYKYLGIRLQYNGKFTKEIPNIKKKITSFQKFQLLNKAHLSTHTTKTFITSYITSKFLYHILIIHLLTK